MKRFIPVLVLMLVLSSLALGAGGAYATTTWTTALAAVGSSGESGSIVLTAADPTISPTEVYITDHNASGAPVNGTRSAGIYSGKCNNLGTPLNSLHNITGGTSDTTGVPYSLNSLIGSSPYYAIVVKDPATNLTLSCADVGMPSVNFPTILTFRIVYDPVTQPSVVIQTLAGHLRVEISLSGQLMGTEFAAYVRQGTCDNLDPVAPTYILNDVVNGQSITHLAVDDVLPDGFAITIEKPGSALGDYVACTETGTYSVSAELKPLKNSGVSGQITATNQIRATKQPSHLYTEVVVKLAGEQFGQPASLLRQLSANIYQGSCPNPSPPPAYQLSRIVGGLSSTEVPVDINELTRGSSPYAVVVSRFILGRRVFVACADIPYFGSGTTPGGTMPGMPTTGSADPSYVLLPPALGALALMMLVLGISLRRRAPRRYARCRMRKE